MFEITTEENKQISDWLKEHNKTCEFTNPENQGAIGGRLTYCFTPTGLGLVTKVKCACGGEKNVTNYDDW